MLETDISRRTKTREIEGSGDRRGRPAVADALTDGASNDRASRQAPEGAARAAPGALHPRHPTERSGADGDSKPRSPARSAAAIHTLFGALFVALGAVAFAALGLSGGPDHAPVIAIAGGTTLAVLAGVFVWFVRTDLSQRGRSEAYLDATKARLRTISDSAPFGIAITDADDGSILFANRQAINLAGGGPEARRDDHNIVDFYNSPEERQSLLEELRTHGQLRGRELRARTFDGREVWVSVNVTVTELDGRKVHVATIQDVSSLRKARAAEERSQRLLRLIADNSPVHIFLKDLDGRFLFANRAFLQFLGRGADEIIGKTAFDMLPRERARMHREREEWVRTTRLPVKYSIAMTRPDGETETIQASKFPITDEDGVVTMIGGANVVTTRETALERQSAIAAKMEAIGRLTGGIAHDFNNVLAVIVACAEEIVHLHESVEDARQAAGTIIDAVERGSSLTSRMMTFARENPLESRTIHPADLVRSLRSFLQRAIGEDIDLRLAIPRETWFVHVDPSELENALLNLAVNARDAMPDGGRIEVSAENITLGQDRDIANELAAGQYVRLTMSDTGPGMPESVSVRAFDPFFTTKEVGKGTGLGLSSVYGFARQSGGAATIDSGCGAGTAISLWLPRARSDQVDRGVYDKGGEAEPELHGNTAAPDAGPHKDAASKVTILVVEDEATVRSFLCGQLRSLGYNVIEAVDGPSAMSVLEDDATIDLLFTDIVMPGGMNGRDLAERARRMRPGLKVLYTTGYEEPEQGAGRKRRFSGPVLRKPYRRAELANRLREALAPVTAD